MTRGILVRASLIALAAFPFPAAAQDDADPSEGTDPVRGERTARTLTVTVKGRGATRSEADADALRQLADALRQALPDLQSPTQIQVPPSIDDLPGVTSEVRETEGRFKVSLSAKLDDVGALTRPVRAGALRTAPRILPHRGLVVLAVDPSLPELVVGDVLLFHDGRSIDDQASLLAAIGAMGVIVERGVAQIPVSLISTEAPVRDMIRKAPTCGPCCHGSAECRDLYDPPVAR